MPLRRRPAAAPPDRPTPVDPGARHFVTGATLRPPFPPGSQRILFGMGCFWGAERRFWSLPGVLTTVAGYAGGHTRNPTYEDVCTGLTGHAEVVLVVYDPTAIALPVLLATFWEGHDPTQGERQGNDVGPQYRSVLFWTTAEQWRAAERSRAVYQERLTAAGYGPITTEIAPERTFFPAEAYHQQYLAKHPEGYCGLGGTGVACPVGLDA